MELISCVPTYAFPEAASKSTAPSTGLSSAFISSPLATSSLPLSFGTTRGSQSKRCGTVGVVDVRVGSGQDGLAGHALYVLVGEVRLHPQAMRHHTSAKFRRNGPIKLHKRVDVLRKTT